MITLHQQRHVIVMVAMLLHWPRLPTFTEALLAYANHSQPPSDTDTGHALTFVRVVTHATKYKLA